MKRCYRADFSDPAFPCVRECHASSEDATTFANAKKAVLETIRENLSHWRTQLKMARAEKAKSVEPYGKPLSEVID